MRGVGVPGQVRPAKPLQLLGGPVGCLAWLVLMMSFHFCLLPKFLPGQPKAWGTGPRIKCFPRPLNRNVH